ncbi:hypothetical protein [Gemmobacter denitrificans]|uniref:Uncharacterized protein n=1 Tax=Gemmobacter denitrificans TaxID=3123040 RepID=A0ABU8BXZ7_9RHOB
MIRPEARALLARWGETGFALAVLVAGLWLGLRGGWILLPLGIALALLGAGLALIALRRLRFATAIQDQPGLVEVDEQQLAYLGPTGGGYVSLDDLIELRLLSRGGQRFWRLKQADGQALLVPVAANGADRLFDAFAALPGLDAAGLIAALHPPPGGPGLAPREELGPILWRRRDRAAVKPALT